MIPRAGLFLFLLILPVYSHSQPDQNLRSRITIDGFVDEYTGPEWVIDAIARFPEPAADSRWGLDNDLRRMAVTWDYDNLYLAVDCSAVNAAAMLFIDCGCGGPAGLQNDVFFRRNIAFRNFTPNVLVLAASSLVPPEAVAVDCDHPPRRLAEDRYSARFLQRESRLGALEIALPWECIGNFTRTDTGVAVPEEGYSLSICAAISGGDAAGAGDALPDPSSALAGDSASLAVLDNYVTIPLDADRDGMLDTGIEPRQAAAFALSSTAGSAAVPGIGLAVDKKVFAPAAGEMLGFRPVFDGEYPLPAHVTAGVYSAAGKLVRVMFSDRAMMLERNSPAEWILWDGRDSSGEVVPGGVYILSVRCSETPAGTRSAAKEAVAVVH